MYLNLDLLFNIKKYRFSYLYNSDLFLAAYFPFPLSISYKTTTRDLYKKCFAFDKIDKIKKIKIDVKIVKLNSHQAFIKRKRKFIPK